jgi:hypothetical protein
LSRYGGWRQSNGLLKQHPNVRGRFPLRAAVTTFLVNNKIGQGQEMLAGLVSMITKHLKKGERVKIAGLGILQVRESGCPHGPQSDDRRADPDQGVARDAF